jgi:ubiquinone/menaquinone biosynthesis C-methylase UbiE
MMRRVCPYVLLATLLAAPALAQGEGHGHHGHAGHHGDKHPLVHTFEDAERYAAMFESKERDAWQKPDEVVRALDVKEGAIVADIGAGSGYFARRLARAVGSEGTVYGIDIEPGMLRILRDLAKKEGVGNVIPILAGVDDPAIPPGGADLIFICDTIHHIPDLGAYYRKLREAARPGARLVIVDFEKKEAPVGPPVEHKLAKDDVVAEAAAGGWKLAKSHDGLLPHQYVLELTATSP